MALMRVIPEDVASYEAFPSQAAAVNTLCYAVREMPLPGCLALYGAWGSGKSSVLQKAAEVLRAEPTTVPVYFDPWEHERRDDVITPLLLAIYGADGGRAQDIDSAKQSLGAVLRGLSKVAWRVGSEAALRKLGIDAAEARELTTEVTQNVSGALQSLTKLTDEVNEIKTQFAEVVSAVCGGDRHRRVVVLLDDLDRCLPDTAVSLIEAIKLALCASHHAQVCFVFAIDRTVLGEAIRHRYPSASTYSAESYLEKIFDLSLEMPPITSADIGTLLSSPAAGLTGLGAHMDECFKHSGSPVGAALVSAVLAEPVFANPRVAQRVFNRLGLLLRNEGCRQRLAAVAIEHTYRRFLAWVAGAERFRPIRDFLHRASDEEWLDLTIALRGQPPRTSEVKRFFASPHTLAYLSLLKPETEDRTLSPPAQLKTLSDFDNLLREAGL